MQTRDPTHVAFSDESHYTKGRYRDLAVVSLPMECLSATENALRQLLDESGVDELKWERLKRAKERFAAEKVVRLVVDAAQRGDMRVDVLVWDTHDDRHAVQKRDDIANLIRMYEHCFQNLLARRWPLDARWMLYPDENSAIAWNKVKRGVTHRPIHLTRQPRWGQGALFGPVKDWVNVNVCGIEPCHSDQHSLCQVADVFAGLGVYSRESYQKLLEWDRVHGPQPGLDLEEPLGDIAFSNADKERALVVLELYRLCKQRKLGVGLRSGHGLRTRGPSNPINFWLYERQHDADVAPVKGQV